MRNVLDFTSTHTRYRYRNGILSNTGTTSRKATRTQRSDGHPTEPTPTGIFYQPTEYESFFCFTSAVPGESEWRVHQWPYTGTWVYYKQTWDGWSDRGTWSHGCNPITLRPDVSESCRSEARAKAVANLRNNDFNVGVTLLEIQESIKTIAGLLLAARALLTHDSRWLNLALKNMLGESIYSTRYGLRYNRTAWGRRVYRRVPRSRRAIAAVSAGYLNYMYGIKPLMSDIYSLCQGISDKLSQGDIVSVEATATDNFYQRPFWTGLSYERTVQGKFERGCKVGMTWRTQNPTLFQLWQYGVTNPLELAWEVTPLSFVVDWFINVGAFLSSLQRPMGMNFSHGYSTDFVDNDFELLESMVDEGPNTEVIQPTYARVPVRTRAMYRQVLYWEVQSVPYIRLGLNLNQTLSSVALLTQRFLKLR